ncbi:hypothetical protein TNCT_72611 [Trichonephila clavata]|uniref:Uncharacterized protein n=1 Tax=Trichonephila clavata TaxID=2740835 RepID=A0A8X6H2K4_TRICU|nr:hypothetical protein TNCT_72611 [Trichonephila clavata]
MRKVNRDFSCIRSRTSRINGTFIGMERKSFSLASGGMKTILEECRRFQKTPSIPFYLKERRLTMRRPKIRSHCMKRSFPAKRTYLSVRFQIDFLRDFVDLENAEFQFLKWEV